MKVDAKDLTIKALLKKGKFIIPDFQREYDWNVEEASDFLLDLKRSDVKDEYFIGSIVSVGEFSGDEFEVIDGQQRITTITIFYAGIRDKFIKMGEKDLANGINDNYIFSKNDEGKYYEVLVNHMPYPILQTYVQSPEGEKDKSKKAEKEGEKKIVKVYDHFMNTIDKYNKKELEELRDKIHSLTVVFVTVDNQTDAFTIFETLNARGKDLSPIDLVKNQVFKYYPNEPHINEPNDSWSEIRSNCRGRIDKFLNNYWSSKYKKVSERTIYKEFHTTIVEKNPEKNIKAFLSDFKYNSEFFTHIVDPSPDDFKNFDMYLAIFAITKVLSIEVSNSLLIALLRGHIEKKITLKMTLEALKAIEDFHFVHTAICKSSSSGLDVFYSRRARRIEKETNRNKKHEVIKEIISELKSKKPSYTTFENNFVKRLFFTSENDSNKNLVKYFLEKTERTKQKNVKFIDCSIEHIYPENHKDHSWTSIDNPDLIGQIGNLVLLDRDVNSKIGNANFETKKKIILEKNKISTTEEVFKKNTDWTSTSIEKRNKNLCDLAYNKIWTVS